MLNRGLAEVGKGDRERGNAEVWSIVIDMGGWQ